VRRIRQRRLYSTHARGVYTPIAWTQRKGAHLSPPRIRPLAHRLRVRRAVRSQVRAYVWFFVPGFACFPAKTRRDGVRDDSLGMGGVAHCVGLSLSLVGRWRDIRNGNENGRGTKSEAYKGHLTLI
jgi:hypothetical protein